MTVERGKVKEVAFSCQTVLWLKSSYLLKYSGNLKKKGHTGKGKLKVTLLRKEM